MQAMNKSISIEREQLQRLLSKEKKKIVCLMCPKKRKSLERSGVNEGEYGK